MKSLDERRKAISQAISRAYGTSVYPVEIPTEHAERDVRVFVTKTAGKPHKDLSITDVAALALFRAGTMPGDEAMASTLADLMDGGVSLDRQAAAPRGLDQLMSKHRAARAKKAPLPSDLRKQARGDAPAVVKRGGGSAVRRPVVTPAAKTAARVAVGSRVHYRRLDDETEHTVVLGAPRPGDVGIRGVPMTSPLANALLGSTQGTIVTVMIAGTAVEIEVLDVRA